MMLDPKALAIDADVEIDRIVGALRVQVLSSLKRRGLVLGLSGGVDSSVVAALAARALGKDRVLGLFLNEGESAGETLELAPLLAESLGIATLREDLTPILGAMGCYSRRDDAIRSVIPDYGAGWKCKIVLPSVIDSDRYRTFWVVVRSPAGAEISARLPATAYLEIVAATSMKQRMRKLMEYTHADRLVYAVAGTPNRLEYDQGFFVKGGDGAADVKPIAHLYKTQVYALAERLGIPEEIRRRLPTTDTYSLPQSQEEFYFSLPYQKMDLAVFARDRGFSPEDAASGLGLTATQVARVYKDIDAKRAQARYLHAAPMLVDSARAP